MVLIENLDGGIRISKELGLVLEICCREKT